MSVQPIDLSTMYSQLDNVAKFNASQNASTQILNQLNINRAALENLEKSKSVNEVSKDDGDSEKVNKDGHNNSDEEMSSAEKKERVGREEEIEKPRQWEFTDPRLGRHIDIQG